MVLRLHGGFGDGLDTGEQKAVKDDISFLVSSAGGSRSFFISSG